VPVSPITTTTWRSGIRSSIRYSYCGELAVSDHPSGTALPFLGMIYTAMLIYDARSDRWQLFKQFGSHDPPQNALAANEKGIRAGCLDPTSILTSSAGFPLGHPERDKINS
jgi:hypothetical protein